MPRAEKAVQEFDAKLLAILPEIKKGKDKKKRVRGQDKWGFSLMITKGPRKGEFISLWGHRMRSVKDARIGSLKAGEKLHITIINHHTWKWKKIAGKAKAKAKGAR